MNDGRKQMCSFPAGSYAADPKSVQVFSLQLPFVNIVIFPVIFQRFYFQMGKDLLPGQPHRRFAVEQIVVTVYQTGVNTIDVITEIIVNFQIAVLIFQKLVSGFVFILQFMRIQVFDFRRVGIHLIHELGLDIRIENRMADGIDQAKHAANNKNHGKCKPDDDFLLNGKIPYHGFTSRAAASLSSRRT